MTLAGHNARARARLAILGALAVLVAAVVSGCGSSAGGVNEALGFVPKGAPLVITLKTDTTDAQYKRLQRLLSRFPGGSQIAQSLVTRLNAIGTLNYQRDLKPVLGNDLVFAEPSAGSLSGNAGVLALKAKDAGKAKQLLQRTGTKVGSSHGSDVFHSQGGQFDAVKNGILVQAPTESDLDQALSRADGSDHMSVSDLDARLTGLPKDALLRVGGDLQALISQSASGGTARRVPWVNALQTFGIAASAENDGVAIDFNVKTSPTGIASGDLPLAAGGASPPVIRRAGEIGVGVRGLDQTIHFAESAGQAINPTGFGRFNTALAQIGARYHVDINRDLFGQLSGNTSISIGLDGGFALRTELPNANAFRSTLAKLAPAFSSFASGAGLPHAALVKPGHGNPFYALAGSNGKRYVFGVVDNGFVLATDATRAGAFAAQAPQPVPAASGALSIESDAHAVAGEIIRRSKRASSAQPFIGPLGQLVGSIRSSTDGLIGHLTLTVR